MCRPRRIEDTPAGYSAGDARDALTVVIVS